MKLVCLGDSLTFGYGVPRSDTWVSLLDEALDLPVVNAGVTGDTTGGMLARFQHSVVGQGASHVFLMGGANDILLSGETAGAKANLGALVYRSLAEGIVPILGLPIPAHPSAAQTQWGRVFDFSQAGPKMEELCGWISRFADGFGIAVVDFRPIFGTPPQGEYYLDGLHVTPRGHRRMAEQFLARGFFPEKSSF